jgi:hypothetical protein
MANYFARKAGNIDAADVWATTPSGTASDVWSTFTAADVLHSNNFAITVNVSTTVGEVRNFGNSSTGGGSFTLSNGVTLTANVISGAASTCVTFAGTSGNSASIVGDCTSGASGTNIAVTNTSTGTLNITGNVTSGGNAPAANNTSAGVLNITGNATGTTNGSGAAANNASTGTLNLTGNATASSGGTGAAANNASTGTLSIIGTVTASQTAAGVAGTNVQQVTILSGPFITETTRGVNPVYCAAWRWNASPSNSTYLEVMTNTLGAKRNLVTADNVTGMPAEADVKDGVVYGPASELTGTFEQTVAPSANDIRDAVWGAATSSLTTAGSIGERLKNCASVASTGDQLEAALTAP